MSDFPTLKTGAVLQYPAQKDIQFSTDVLRFADGSEQRFRGYKTSLHRWIIRLDLLDETELHVLREFFRTESGAAESFSFTDPWNGTVYPHCNLEGDEILEELRDEAKGKTALTVRENRG
jgi:phage-related protein